MRSSEDQNQDFVAATAANSELTGLHFKAKAVLIARAATRQGWGFQHQGKHTLKITSHGRESDLLRDT